MPTLEEIRNTFSADRFATEAAGAEIQSAEPGHAVCTMVLRPIHMNAAHTPQGGAVFTLADFSFAVAANGFSERVTVSLQHDITYLSPARGRILTAEAQCIKSGRTACIYSVDVTDDAGTHVAYMTVNGFITDKPAAALEKK